MLVFSVGGWLTAARFRLSQELQRKYGAPEPPAAGASASSLLHLLLSQAGDEDDDEDEGGDDDEDDDEDEGDDDAKEEEEEEENAAEPPSKRGRWEPAVHAKEDADATDDAPATESDEGSAADEDDDDDDGDQDMRLAAGPTEKRRAPVLRRQPSFAHGQPARASRRQIASAAVVSRARSRHARQAARFAHTFFGRIPRPS